MLVLGRRPYESIIILCDGRRIEVMYIPDKLGVIADKDIVVIRKEKEGKPEA